MRPLEIRRLGLVRYDEALAMQRALVEERRADRVPDVLLLLQHPAVITLGVKGDGGRANIVATEARLADLGIDVHETGRGGDVTYHGPGQIVGYPIIDLAVSKIDLKKYLARLEELMIRAVAAYGISAGRQEGMTGAWVGDRKIGAIGVRVEKWVTSHGFALNANNDLGGFDLIIPCGLKGKGVTSIAREIGHEVDLDELRRSVAKIFGEVVGRRMIHEA